MLNSISRNADDMANCTCRQWDTHQIQGHSTLKVEQDLAFWLKDKPKGSYGKWKKNAGIERKKKNSCKECIVNQK